eukprot:Trichotokara_eunicae@DN4783_c1_g1_i1.p1
MNFQLGFSGWKKMLQDFCEIDVVRPALPAEGEPEQSVKSISPDGKFYEWWHNTLAYTGVDKSMQYIAELMKGKRYDGVLGFSQGAAMASILLDKSHRLNKKENLGIKTENNDLIIPYPFKFGILISGFPPVGRGLSSKIDIPTFNTYGRKEINGILAAYLCRYFKDPFVEVHQGGHIIPTPNPQFKEKFESFLENQSPILH